MRRDAGPTTLRSLLRGFDGGYGDGVVLFGSGHGGLGAGLLVEGGQGGLVARIERIDLVTDYEGILRSLRDASTSASGGVWHGVLGAAHGVTDSACEAFAAGGISGKRKSCNQQNIPKEETSFPSWNGHQILLFF